jgi:hypothetical protein
LRETLVCPAELAGYSFEDAAIVDDMMQLSTSRGALPLLSFAASRLWEARDRHNKQLTRAAYQQMGGVAGAFARHADQVASAIGNQALLRAILMRLVTPDGTRAVVDQRELLSLASDPREVERILDHLVRARLIHTETDPDQTATVEIVHEILINEWPTLNRWLEDSHAMRAFTHELRQAAKQWAARGKAPDLVWRGATAQEALGHARRYVLDLSHTEKEFLAAIKTHVTRARRRNVLAFSSVVIALGLVFAGGSVALVRIKNAESVAQEKAKQAEIDRKAAVDASGQLRDKIGALEAANKARDAAEHATKEEEQRRIAAEQSFAHSEELSREQLEQQVVVARAAQKKAEEERARAVEALRELKIAKQQVEDLLAKEHKERLEIEKRMKVIATTLHPETK